MTNNKQQTAVDFIYLGMSDKIVMQDLNKALICIHISHDDFIKLLEQAQEIEKQRIAKAFTDGKAQNFSFYDKTGEQYYEQTYGGGNK